MSLQNFLSELKRRRVFRVVAVYAVAAWAVMQFADLVFPRLNLPDWTVTLVIALAIIGLPIAIGLAWAFDLTGDGIQRTPSADVQPEALPMRPHRALWFVAGIIVALTIGWLAVKRGNRSDIAIDKQLIAVLPFRVAGADPSLKYLREGMLDLMAASLVVDEGTRSVDPPTIIARWKQAVKSQDEDLPVDSARGVARAMRAGHVVIGSIIGAPNAITVNVDLVDVMKGTSRRIRATGKADSLPQLVDHVAGEILGYVAGEHVERASMLARVPLPALRAYLRGTKEYRSGNYEASGKHFSDALRSDSTFVLAAVGLRSVSGWIPMDPVLVKSSALLAWTHKDELPIADRASLIAQLGPHYPEPSSGTEMVEAAREAVRLAPDRAESYNWLGEWLYHTGDAVGIANAREEAVKAFERVMALDGPIGGPAEHIAELALHRGDTATVRKMTGLVLASDSNGVTARALKILHGVSSGDAKAAQAVFAAVKAGLDPTTNFLLVYQAQASGYGLEQADSAVAMSKADFFPAYFYELNRGRPQRARRFLDETPSPARAYAANEWLMLMTMLQDGGDTAHAASAVQRVIEVLKQDSISDGVLSSRLCVLTQWQIAHGDYSATSAALARLRSVAPPRAKGYLATLCADLIDAQRAIRDRRPDADALLAHADSVSATSPAGVSALSLHFLNMQLARAFEARGETRRALAALRRRVNFLATAQEYLSPSLLWQARLATKLGERDAAVRNYALYLKLMSKPEPSERAKVERARRELAALTVDR